MAVAPTPHVTFQSRFDGSSLTPVDFFDTARALAKDKVLFPELASATVTMTGDFQLSGDLDDQVRSEVVGLDPTTRFQTLTADLRGAANKTRLLFTISPALKTFSFNYQNVPNDATRARARSAATELAVLLESQTEPTTPSEFGQFAPQGRPNGPYKGAVIDRYRLLDRLGSGFSAEVWKAKVVGVPPGVRLRLADEVAIKLYNRLIDNGSDSVRVQREFRVATSLDHPNLVRVYDLVLSPSRPLHNFLVMELVHGRTLKTAIPRNGMAIDRIVAISRNIFGALHALHGLNALHRDVKAANIMLTEQSGVETAKLCDLGIVSVIGDPSMTGTSVFLGSKHSASLEQMLGEDLDARTDIYSAGTVMYHCYTGSPMYHRTGPEGAIVRRMLESPERLAPKTNDKRDIELVALINACTAVDAADRPDSATTVLAKLDGV